MTDNRSVGGESIFDRSIKEGSTGTLLYASIFDSCFDAIDFKTPDGVIAAWNPAAERLYGFTAREMIGNHVSSLYSRENYPEFSRRFDLAKEKLRQFRFRSTRITSSNTSVSVFVTLSPVVDPRGRLLGVSAISRDISREKALVEETHRLARDREELLSIIGNDVQNSINQFHRIVTNLDIDEKQSEIRLPRPVFDALLKSNSDFGRSIENLLRVYSLAPKDSLALRPVRILDILRTMVGSCDSALGPNFLFHEELDNEHDIIVQADARMLKRLFTNLLDWAASHCRLEIPISLSVRSKEAYPNLEVIIEFAGKSYDETEIEALFSSRWREANGAETGSMSGLGLFLSRWTAEAHGGCLNLLSNRGQNIFEIVLPKLQISPKNSADNER